MAGELMLLLVPPEGNRPGLQKERGNEMFGRKKSSSAVKQKQRWFFKVENAADAEDAIKICYGTFYALAAIQAVVLTAFYFISNTSVSNLFDPVLMVSLAWFVHHKKSRTAAVMLGMYAIPIAIITLGNRAGVDLTGGFGGRNIFLAAFALYGAYKGLQGTFKYHRFARHEVITKNVWKMIGLFFLYNIVAVGILVSVTLAVPALEQGFWGYGESAFSEDVVGGVLILCIFIASMATVFRVLPGTKDKPLIGAKTSDAS